MTTSVEPQDTQQPDYPALRKLTREEIRALPPGPRPKGPLDRLSEFIWPTRKAITKIEEASEYGDLSSFYIGPYLIFQINSPPLIKEAFIDNYENIRRGEFAAARWALGNGLLLANPPQHREHRRVMQPEFYRHRVAMYCNAMVDSAVNHVSAWEEGQRVDFLNSMSMLGSDITGKTLFGLDLSDRTEQMGHNFETVLRYVFKRSTQHPKWSKLAHKLPLPSSRAFHRIMREFNELIYGLIKERRTEQRIHDDFISVMVQQQQRPGEEIDIYAMIAAEARGESEVAPSQAEAPSGNGGCPVQHEWWSDEQVRDEAMTFLLAGQESYHIAMSWTMHYLSIMPDLQERLHREVDEVLQGRQVDIADFPNLELVDKLIYEVMRIFAPLGIIGRVAYRDITIGGHLVPQGSAIVVPIVLLHRREEVFSDPLEFNPDRWTPEFRNNLDRFAYIPFGVGHHRCIGEQFAWMQMRVTLTTIAQHWRVHPDPGHTVEPEPHFTLAPKGGMPLYLERRK